MIGVFYLLTFLVVSTTQRSLVENQHVLSGSVVDDAQIEPVVQLGLRADLAEIAAASSLNDTTQLNISSNQNVSSSNHSVIAKLVDDANATKSVSVIEQKKAAHAKDEAHALPQQVNETSHSTELSSSLPDVRRTLDKEANATTVTSVVEQKKAIHAEDESHVLPHHNESIIQEHVLNETPSQNVNRMKIETTAELASQNQSGSTIPPGLTPEEAKHFFHHHVPIKRVNQVLLEIPVQNESLPVDPHLGQNISQAHNKELERPGVSLSSHFQPENATVEEKALKVNDSALIHDSVLDHKLNSSLSEDHENHTEIVAHNNQLKSISQGSHHDDSGAEQNQNSSHSLGKQDVFGGSEKSEAQLNHPSNVSLAVPEKHRIESDKNDSATHKKKKVAWHDIMKSADDKERQAAVNRTAARPLVLTQIHSVNSTDELPSKKSLDMSAMSKSAIFFSGLSDIDV